jgi:predicted transposase/invertase (TIGR01784 family)
MSIAQEKYISPFTDFGFKKIFGTEVNKDLLLDFLNELIKDKGKITDLSYLNAEQLGMTEYERKAVFDIYCQTESGERFIVEMQKAKQDFFKDRSVFYATFPIREQAVKGKSWDFELSAVYAVGILNFVFNNHLEDKDYYHSEVKLMDVVKKEVFYDKLTFIYLEMPKFNKDVNLLNTRFEKWMYVLKNLSKLQDRPVALQEKIFERLFRVAEIAKLSKKELDEYENSLKAYRDWENIIDTAKREARMSERENMTLMMLRENEPIEKIIRYTGLNEEQIKKLKT